MKVNGWTRTKIPCVYLASGGVVHTALKPMTLLTCLLTEKNKHTPVTFAGIHDKPHLANMIPARLQSF